MCTAASVTEPARRSLFDDKAQTPLYGYVYTSSDFLKGFQSRTIDGVRIISPIMFT